VKAGVLINLPEPAMPEDRTAITALLKQAFWGYPVNNRHSGNFSPLAIIFN